jgi:hypothetical protein
MCEPRRVIALWAFTAFYRYSFTSPQGNQTKYGEIIGTFDTNSIDEKYTNTLNGKKGMENSAKIDLKEIKCRMMMMITGFALWNSKN